MITRERINQLTKSISDNKLSESRVVGVPLNLRNSKHKVQLKEIYLGVSKNRGAYIALSVKSESYDFGEIPENTDKNALLSRSDLSLSPKYIPVLSSDYLTGLEGKEQCTLVFNSTGGIDVTF